MKSIILCFEALASTIKMEKLQQSSKALSQYYGKKQYCLTFFFVFYNDSLYDKADRNKCSLSRLQKLLKIVPYYMKSYFYKQLYQQKSVTINSIHFTKYTYHQMGDKRAFSKIINGFLVQVQLNSAQPSELSFILIQNIQQRNLQLKFGNESMPQQLRTLFNNVNELYQHLSLYQNDRRFFDIFPQGSIKVVKQVKYNNVIDVRTLQLTTYPVQKDLQMEKEDQLPQHPENMCDSQMNDENIDLGGNNLYGTQTSQLSLSSHISQKPIRNINQICDKALIMIRKGTNQYIIARTLKIKHSSVQKMMMQVKLYGMIYPPRVQQNQYNFHHQSPYYAQEQNNNDFIHFQPNQQYYNMNQNQNQQAWSQAPHRQLGPVTPNMKMHGDGVRQIKKILFTLVKQGKMQSLDQMRNYLLERNIDRSLSSIYRYISSIKAENPEFQGRNYTMYRKEMENQSQYKN